MAQRIPEDAVHKIQQSVDIVDVIGEYVQLKKQGRNFFGLCPFHGENTPSFSVSPDKQIFHCFGCGAGGNVFSFLMQIEGYEFVEAVRQISEKEGIPLPEEAIQSAAGSSRENRDEDTAEMLKAHDLLKKFYHHLLVNTKEGQDALDYLLNRGFTKESIEQFEIGYALPSWNFVSKFLANRGFNLPLMEQAGLLVKKNDSSDFLDRFRNRIMFPILDHHGNTIAFSGRVLTDEQPKYLNSPETKLFNKSKVLYNFHKARLHIRKHQQSVLLEGFADVISASKAGVEQSVAAMGTALTDEQAKILKRNSAEVIICYDSDKAGLDAALRSARTLSEAGASVKVAVIPDGLDPDDYINRYGAEKFRQDVIGGSMSVMAFKMHYFRRGKNLQNEAERFQYIEQILKEFAELHNPLEQEIYLKQISGEFAISLEVLKERLTEVLRTAERPKEKKEQNKAPAEKPMAPRKRKKLLPAFHNAERMLLAHMLKNKEAAQKVLDTLGLQFNIEEHRVIATYLYAFYEEGTDEKISTFIQRLPNKELMSAVTDIAMIQVNDEPSSAEIQDYMKQILNYPKILDLQEKEAEKNEAERERDFVKAARIAMEIVHLKRSFKQ
ncbi:DNA primase [Bacillus sp. FJAT-42376]|uniref:DNA primase n=1 Tax=Bacillus sp. FJAT-42376 TaxID=2014076 RepID=UPI000F508D56|nr:DNA primase [Bacillus sp. FJAT-42376]AZB43658.1 DNA primase [Bacillus sp. FJAT-42376]